MSGDVWVDVWMDRHSTDRKHSGSEVYLSGDLDSDAVVAMSEN